MIHVDDVSAWKTTLDIIVLVGMLILYTFVYWVMIKGNAKRSAFIIVTVCFVVFLIGHTLNAFIFFDSGQIPEATPVQEDGHAKIVQKAPDLTPEDQLEASQEAKKSKYLKAQDQGPQEAREESEAYLKKLLERNK